MDADAATLDFGTLCHLVGAGFNARIVERLGAEGYPGVKASYGYVVQHLLADARTVTELAGRMGVTQQAASKRVREMIDAGLLVEVEASDRRQRRVTLSDTGHDIVRRTRRLRGEVAAEMLAGAARADVETARAVLIAAIEALGLSATIRTRTVREPR